MAQRKKSGSPDFKGFGFSKIGHSKEMRTKTKELETLNLELARRHNQLESIFNSISDGLTIIDRDLNILFTNKVQKTMFPEVSLVGKKCYNAFFRKRHVCRDCPARMTLERQKVLRGEVLIKEGEYAGRYYEWTTSPIQDTFGQTYEVVLTMRDITERKEIEFKLIEADHMASIGLLASGIAHEINNPLTSIAGFSEGLLKRLKTNPELGKNKDLNAFQEYLEIIYHEAYRCKETISHLVEFCQKSDEEIVALDQIIQDVIFLIRQHAKDRQINVMFKNQLLKGFNQIRGNSSQLKYIFLTLFNKSFEGLENGGKLNALIKNSSNEIEIFISIIGPGLPEKEKSRKAALSSTPLDETDLSFSICYNVIRRHQGTIQIDYPERGGHVFSIKFPFFIN